MSKEKYQKALDELSYPLADSSCGGCKCGESDCCDCKKAKSVVMLQELIDKHFKESKEKLIVNIEQIFKTIGYRLEKSNDDIIQYYKDDDNMIIFYLDSHDYCKTGKWDGSCDAITIEEHLAIHQQLIKLKWI